MNFKVVAPQISKNLTISFNVLKSFLCHSSPIASMYLNLNTFFSSQNNSELWVKTVNLVPRAYSQIVFLRLNMEAGVGRVGEDTVCDTRCGCAQGLRRRLVGVPVEIIWGRV